MKTSYITIPVIASVLALSVGCKKGDSNPQYTVPTTYNYSNVDVSEQTTRLGMVAEIETEMNKGNTALTVVSAAKLKNMFANTGSLFTNAAFNTSGLQIKNKCFAAAQADLESYMDSLALASQSTIAASNGVAGVGTSSDGTRKQLLSANGVNYRQLFSKSIMGALIAYQITQVYLTDSISNSVDNINVTAGKGTLMEHHWDEAFGYWAVPKDFPTNKTGLKYWASYANQVDSGIRCNAAVMNAFLKGRAAISNNDMSTKSAQADIIITFWDKMTAAAAIHELNEAKSHITDVVTVCGNLSESMGFVRSLRYNKNQKRIITDAQINTVLALYGTNMWNISIANINSIIDTLSSIYGFDSVKSFM